MIGVIRQAFPYEGYYLVQIHGQGDNIRASYTDAGIVTTWPPGTPVLLEKAHGGWRVVGRWWAPRSSAAPVDNDIDRERAVLNQSTVDFINQQLQRPPDQNQETPHHRPADQKAIANETEKVITNGLGLFHLFDDGSILMRAAHSCFSFWNATKSELFTTAQKIFGVIPGIKWIAQSIGGISSPTKCGVVVRMLPNIVETDPAKIELVAGHDVEQPVPGSTPVVNLTVGSFLELNCDAVTGDYTVTLSQAPAADGSLSSLQIKLSNLDATGPKASMQAVVGGVVQNAVNVSMTGAEVISGTNAVLVNAQGIDIKSLIENVAIAGQSTRTVTGIQSETVNADSSSTVNGSRSETTNGAKAETVIGVSNENIEGSKNLQVSGAVSENIQGAKNINIAGAYTVNVAGAIVLNTLGTVAITAPGGVKIVGNLSVTGTITEATL